MDLLKALKRTTIISGTALLAFAATDAHAAVDTATLGHISASLQGLVNIAETSPMKFGNFSLSAAGANSVTLSPSGTRTTVGAQVTLVNDSAGDGVAAGTDLETGAQAPGFFSITAADAGVTDVYVSFASHLGGIIDAAHPNNYATLTGPAAAEFHVNAFTFESDDAAATGPDSSGYTQDDPSVTDAYGTKVACVTTCTIRVGATLNTVPATTYGVGSYKGTYFVMVSY